MAIAALIPSISSVLNSGGALDKGARASTSDTVRTATDVDVRQTAGGGPMIQSGAELPVWIILAVAALALVIVFKK